MKAVHRNTKENFACHTNTIDAVENQEARKSDCAQNLKNYSLQQIGKKYVKR